MRIVIVGAGKIGYYLADCLVDEDHDVVVIEEDEERRAVIDNHLDVLTVQGNGASPGVLEDSYIRSADLIIAVTDSDEVNMIVCAVAKQVGIKQTVARIRNLEYINYEGAKEFQNSLGIDLVINPELAAAVEIDRVLTIPNALEVGDFADGKVRLLEMRIRPASPLVGIPLQRLRLPPHTLVAGILRNNKMIIPRGNDQIKGNDHAFFIGDPEVLSTLETGGARVVRPVANVLIIGAGRIGYHLALMLESKGMRVKVVDNDLERCESLAKELKKGRVLCGEGTDVDLLQEEGIGEADALICLTDDDKLNLLLALIAKDQGVPKTIARVGRTEYIPLLEKVGVDIIVAPRLIAAGVILSQVRRGKFVSVSFVEGAKAQAMEVIVSTETTIAGKKLKDVKLPANCLIGAVVHESEAFVPNGDSILYHGDRAIIFALPDTIAMVEKIF